MQIDARRLWLWHSLLSSLLYFVAFSMLAIWLVRDLGLDPLQMVLVGTAMEAACFVFEIPTGVVADRWSRRGSIVIGVAIHGAAILLAGFSSGFAGVALAWGLMGFGYTFLSGAATAWLADEIGPDALGPVLFRASQLRALGSLLGIGVGAALASVELSLPIRAAGAGLLVWAGLLAWWMPERGFTPEPRGERGQLQQLGATLSEAGTQVRANPVVLLLLAVAFFDGAHSEGIDRLTEPLFLETIGFPDLGSLSEVAWIAVLRCGVLIAGIGATEWARRRVDTTDPQRARRVLRRLAAIQSLAIVTFALAGDPWLAFAGVWLSQATRAAAGPIESAWINRDLPSSSRATVLSIVGQGDAIGQILGGPGVGWIGRSISLRAALVTSGLLLTPALWLYGRSLRGAPAREERDG